MNIENTYHNLTFLNTDFELLVRDQLFHHAISYILILSLIILAWVKLINTDFLKKTFLSIFRKNTFVIDQDKSTNSIVKASILLTLNYFLLSALTVYMLKIYYELTFPIIFILIPSTYFLFVHLCMIFGASITGDIEKVKSNIRLYSVVHQLLGVILLPLILLWYLNPDLSEFIIILIFIFTFLLLLLRLVRGFFIGIENKFTWYYLILYFCTLEIWPIAVLIKIA